MARIIWSTPSENPAAGPFGTKFPFDLSRLDHMGLGVFRDLIRKEFYLEYQLHNIDRLAFRVAHNADFQYISEESWDEDKIVMRNSAPENAEIRVETSAIERYVPENFWDEYAIPQVQEWDRVDNTGRNATAEGRAPNAQKRAYIRCVQQNVSHSNPDSPSAAMTYEIIDNKERETARLIQRKLLASARPLEDGRSRINDGDGSFRDLDGADQVRHFAEEHIDRRRDRFDSETQVLADHTNARIQQQQRNQERFRAWGNYEDACEILGLDPADANPRLPLQKDETETLNKSQIVGVAWLVKQQRGHLHLERLMGSLVADEMGTGKTKIAAACIAWFINESLLATEWSTPKLVVVPKATLYDWFQELLKWDLDLLVYWGLVGFDKDQDAKNPFLAHTVNKRDMLKDANDHRKFADAKWEHAFSFTREGTRMVFLSTQRTWARRTTFSKYLRDGITLNDGLNADNLLRRQEENDTADDISSEDDDGHDSEEELGETIFAPNAAARGADKWAREAASNFYCSTTGKKQYIPRTRWQRIDMVVVDEAHTLRNFPPQLCASLFVIKSRFTIAMTGIPIYDKLEDLVALLNLCWMRSIPKSLVGSRATFQRPTFDPFEDKYDGTNLESFRLAPKAFLKFAQSGNYSLEQKHRKLEEVFSRFILRRSMKTEIPLTRDADGPFEWVGAMIPDIKVQTVELYMTGEEWYEYRGYHNQLRLKMFMWLKQHTLHPSILFTIGIRVKQQLCYDQTLLRQLTLCTSSLVLSRFDALESEEYDLTAKRLLSREYQDTRLGLDYMAERSRLKMDTVPDRAQTPARFFDYMAKGGPKLFKLRDIVLRTIVEDTTKAQQIVVWVYHPHTAWFIRTYLRGLLFKCEALTSDLGFYDRRRIINGFNEGGKIEILICQYLVSGVGIDLHHNCATAVIYEPGRSAAQEALAWSRIRRLGQRHEQQVYRLVTMNTANEWIDTNQWRKLGDSVNGLGRDWLKTAMDQIKRDGLDGEEAADVIRRSIDLFGEETLGIHGQVRRPGLELRPRMTRST